MGKSDSVEDRFRKHLRVERDGRKWSQAHLAQLLRDKGIQAHPTTVAKIEAGERAAKIDEIAAIADIFEVSLDRMIGRTVASDADEQHALRALVDTAAQSAWQLSTITNSLRDKVTDLSAFKPTDTSTKRLQSE